MLKKKIRLILLMSFICSCLTGCLNNEHDRIEISNKTAWEIDNISIPAKDGYFYDHHEKFTVDDNTIAITIYFSNDENDTWDIKE